VGDAYRHLSEGSNHEPSSGQKGANVISFRDLVEASTHYPRVKKAWAEIPGRIDDIAV
jgi:hypothetical protein